MSIFKTVIQEIKNNEIILTNEDRLVIMRVEPINFKLKSVSEQEAILEAYKTFLKLCDFDIQIFVQTQEANVKRHKEEIKKCILYEKEISDMAEDYIHLINEISEVRGSVSRKFFLIIKVTEEDKENKINKVREGLEGCGNVIELCTTQELIQILKVCFKKVPLNIATGEQEK